MKKKNVLTSNNIIIHWLNEIIVFILWHILLLNVEIKFKISLLMITMTVNDWLNLYHEWTYSWFDIVNVVIRNRGALDTVILSLAIMARLKNLWSWVKTQKYFSVL